MDHVFDVVFKNALNGGSGLEKERLEEAVVLALTMSQESRAKESRHPPEAGKDRKTGPS